MTHAEARREGGCAIAVMAKAPRPGAVKTRLVPPLTPDAASALSASFLSDICENIRLAGRDCAVHAYIAYAPAGSETCFDGMLAHGTRLILADGNGITMKGVDGFGRPLLHAAQSLFQRGHDSVCLLNSDSPNLPTALLARAARELATEGDRVVLGPAEDGGYYVIGMKAPHVHLFRDIDWSTERVAEQTRQRARSLGLPLHELDSWYDVDDAAALSRLCRDLAREHKVSGLNPYSAPTTARCIERLRISERFDAA
jgi:uncharacterized protein